jgi:SAM-dependent MidA family methyltransferase
LGFVPCDLFFQYSSKSITMTLHNPGNGIPTSLLLSLTEAHNCLPFDQFMAQALYAPGWGYYANASPKFGHMPSSGSDFVTAPELSPYFGRTLAAQVSQALQATQTKEVWEFGAGSGALALQLLQTLDESAASTKGSAPVTYHIVELSASLRERQAARLSQWGSRVQWHEQWPNQIEGVVLGNEVLDAMPVKLLARAKGEWHERGVSWSEEAQSLIWQDHPSTLRPPFEIEGLHDYVTEIHPQAEAFIQSLGERLRRGAAFFIDYGFSEHEYYHPQRHMGTLMAHQAHRSDANVLADVGRKDITAHVNFTGIALAAQDAGLSVLGYTSQGRFLLNCGLLNELEHADARARSMAQKLVTEHEMGELFKVLGLVAAQSAAHFDEAMGFLQGDRSHQL